MASSFVNITETVLNVTSSFGNGSDVTSSSNGGAGGRGPIWFPWANPENVISQKTAEDITSVLQIYIFPILTVFGLVGNVCSIIVLLQKQLRSSTTSIVLAGLAFSDLMFLITNGVRKSTGIIELYDELAAAELTALSFKYIFYFKTAFSRVSTLMVVLISAERFIAVAFPLKAKILITRPRMIFAVLFCYCFTFGGLAAYPPQYTYTYIGEKAFIAYTDFALDNAEGLKVYNEYFLPIVYRHIPVVIVFLLNTIIIIILNKSKRFQKSSSSQDPKRRDDQKKITRMLLTVAFVYLICLLPGDIFLRCSVTVDGFEYFGLYHNLFMALSDISLLFEMFNSCINFVIYMVLNKNFYNTYIRLFCCLCQINFRRQKSDSKNTTSVKTKDTKLSSEQRGIGEICEGVVCQEPRPENEASGEVCENETSGHVNRGYVE